MSVIEEIIAERRRQIEVEGWSIEHDDRHDDEELAWAAVCYAAPELVFKRHDYDNGVAFFEPWPWDIKWDKRTYSDNRIPAPVTYENQTRRQILIKAAALIVAEIERLERCGQEK